MHFLMNFASAELGFVLFFVQLDFKLLYFEWFTLCISLLFGTPIIFLVVLIKFMN